MHSFHPPSNLRCEYLVDPIGVDIREPRLSWHLTHPQRGRQQSACQVQVAADPAVPAGDVWDSGKVEAPGTGHMVYTGDPLTSATSYYWRVRAWDDDDNPSDFSKPARFDTAFFSEDEWQGEWIGGANQLRKEFSLAAPPSQAHVFVCGLGYCELRINGRKAGNSVLDPAFTTYAKRSLYRVYDVTDLLQAGPNALAVMLGEGWYGDRILRLQLIARMTDGQAVTIISDLDWKAKPGPVNADNVYDGETFDACLETPGWELPGYDDVDWPGAAAATPPGDALSVQMMPAIEVVDTIVPLEFKSVEPGVYVYDMGQNFSGWCQLKVRGPRGTIVTMRHAELVYEDGSLNTENLGRARATDTYILKGDGTEIYEPRFTYHGFRYVELRGYPGTPKLDAIRGRVVHTGVEPIGSFACSKEILNKLQRIIVWGQKTNLHSIPTDCCQRAERMGWTGDAHVTAEEAMLNFDMAAFYTNFLRCIRDEQGEDGGVADTVPHKGGRRPGDPAWGAAYPLICWYMYRQYGDRRLLETHYDGVKAWVECLRAQATDGILELSYYGDWVAVENTPGNLVSTFYYAYSAKILADIASILGNNEDAGAYGQLLADIKAAFNRKFFDAEAGTYANGTHTADALAVFLEMMPGNSIGELTGVGTHLAHDILYRCNTHVRTGFIGIKYVMEVLSRIGHTALAYDLATQTSFPSWGYMIENGATTVWELWHNKTGPGMNSHNHPMFGSVGTWMYRTLGGIDQAEDSAGYSRILIAPQIVRDLQWCSASTETVRGTVACAWHRRRDGVIMDVTIPVGSEADVRIPMLGLRNVLLHEGDEVIWPRGTYRPRVDGIISARESEAYVQIAVGPGRYTFRLEGS